jgi:SNF2 family DNA or RNA helicase
MAFAKFRSKEEAKIQSASSSLGESSIEDIKVTVGQLLDDNSVDDARTGLIKKRKKSMSKPLFDDSLLLSEDSLHFCNEEVKADLESIIGKINGVTSKERMDALIESTTVLELHPKIFARLMEHQLKGVNFLFEAFKKKQGCVLADDMGLGKTVQICSYLGALSKKGFIKNALVVAPATLVDYWEAELHRWVPKADDLRVFKLQGTKPQRAKIIATMVNRPGIALMSPETLKSDFELLATKMRWGWDVLVVDEGHRAKNVRTQLRKALKAFPVKRHKVILTGTPV